MNTKLICEPELVPEVVLLELYVLEPAGRIRVQGTATSLPLPDEVLEPSVPLAPLEVPELNEERWLLDPEVPDVLDVPLWPVLESEPEVEPLLPLDSTEMIAKSTRPEAGLMITSLMVPRLESPEEALIWELINFVA